MDYGYAIGKAGAMVAAVTTDAADAPAHGRQPVDRTTVLCLAHQGPSPGCLSRREGDCTLPRL